MVIYKLSPLRRTQWCQTVIPSLVLSFQVHQYLWHSLLNQVSLFFGNTWSKWEILEISSESNPSWNNHCWLFSCEGRTFKFCVIQITDVHSFFRVAVVSLDDLIKKPVECIIWMVTSSIYSYTWIYILNSRKYHPLKWNSTFILFRLVHVEYLWGQKFAQEWFGSSWEFWEADYVIRGFEMISSDDDIT